MDLPGKLRQSTRPCAGLAPMEPLPEVGLRKTSFDQVISLGFGCRTKHQIVRNFWSSGSVHCHWREWLHLKRGVFDYQGTPPQAVLTYLSNDFCGMFEREDLAMLDGRVVNARYETQHRHQFPVTITEATIDEYYATARATHDRRCATTRRALASDASTLILVSKPVPDDFLAAVGDYVRHLNPSKTFQLLQPPENDPVEPWQGDEALWAKHLAGYRVRVPMWARIEYGLKRARKNVRFLLPKSLRPTAAVHHFGGFRFSSD